MSNLVTHAESELRRAGLFDDDADYGGAIGGAVMDLVRVFSAQGHSGASAGMVLAIFDKVARFEALGPLTDDPAEWVEVADGMWQNRRKSAAFSSDGGKTWYDVNDRDRRTVRSVRTDTQTEGESDGAQ